MKHSLSRARFAAVLVLGLALLAGCGSTVTFVPTDTTEYAPKGDQAEIDLYDGNVVRPHVVVGTLSTHGDIEASFDERSTYDSLLAALVKKAREVGADALMEVKPLTSNGGGMKSRLEMTAVAIRYLEKDSSISSESASAGH